MLRRNLTLFLAVLFLTPALAAQELKKQFWEAARKGDAETITALLEKGVDVNTPFRYSATALSFACDRGHVEVVKVLLEHGADVNVKDSFYGATPLTWALSPPSNPPTMENHMKIVRLLLEHGAEGVDRVLLAGVRRGSPELVEVALEKGGLSTDTLTTALQTAEENNRTEIAQKLRQAGAEPPPPVNPEVLRQITGTYRNSTGAELVFAAHDGQLRGGPSAERQSTLVPVDEVTFRPQRGRGVSFRFKLEGGVAISVTLRSGRDEVLYKRTENGVKE